VLEFWNAFDTLFLDSSRCLFPHLYVSSLQAHRLLPGSRVLLPRVESVLHLMWKSITCTLLISGLVNQIFLEIEILTVFAAMSMMLQQHFWQIILCMIGMLFTLSSWSFGVPKLFYALDVYHSMNYINFSSMWFSVSTPMNSTLIFDMRVIRIQLDWGAWYASSIHWEIDDSMNSAGSNLEIHRGFYGYPVPICNWTCRKCS
jgi:hypothetical protein